MHKIDRYGVIALLFLIVTIVTVSMWEDGAKPGEEGVAQAGSQSQGQKATRAKKQQQSQRAMEAAAKRPATSGQGTDAARSRMKLSPDGAPTMGSPAAGLAGGATEKGANTKRRSQAADARTNEQAMQRRAELAARQQDGSMDLKVNEADRKDVQGYGNDGVKARLALGGQTSIETSSRSIREMAQDALDAKQNGDSSRSQRNPGKQAVVASYTVKAGNTLGSISQEFLGSAKHWKLIATANNITDPQRLSVGTKLAIPGLVGEASTPAPKSSGSKTPSTTDTYTVTAGDTLGHIAQRELGSAKLWKSIIEVNPGLKPERLYVGKKIQLPKGPRPQRPALKVNNRVAQATVSGGNKKHFVR